MKSIQTPWGQSQGATKYADGIEFHTTARHGGFKLDRVHNAQVHAAWRRKGGWYEEDCEAYIVLFTFPDAFLNLGKRNSAETAKEALINWFPDQYEAVTGETIPPGASYVRERDNFTKRHANDWVVISATRFGRMVRGVASLGGNRDAERRAFMIDPAEYSEHSQPYGFVIDLSRHEEITL